MLAGTKAIRRALVFSVATALAVGGCTSTKAGDSNPPGTQVPNPSPAQLPNPSRAVVDWVGSVCAATQPRQDGWLPTDSDPAEFQDFRLKSYLRQAPQDVTWRSLQLKTLPPSGVPGGDEFIAAYLRALEALKPELSRLAEGVDSLSVEITRERVRRARELLASVKPEGPDLAALMASDPILARAYELAPSCDPATPPPASAGPSEDPASGAPLPAAADGSDVSACMDGSCEISVSAPTEIAVGTVTVSVTEITANQVTFVQESRGGRTEITTSAGGVAGLNDVGVRIIAISGGTALLRIVSGS